ncbi:MAG: hypothetical protein V1798_11480 [Pseudomonadota bacterium]
MTAFKKRRIATIDIGSNALLMLVAERGENGSLSVLADVSRIPRLGEDLRRTRRIAPAAMERSLNVLREYTDQARSLGALEIFATATNAAREAENRDDFLAAASSVVGSRVELLPPGEEARLTYLSATSEDVGDTPSMVVDIGGGSTEITWGLGNRFDGGRSLDLGTIKLIEGPLTGNPPGTREIDSARREIDERLARITPIGSLSRHYGTAGSFTHLAAVDLGIRDYHPDRVAHHKLTPERVRFWIDKFSGVEREEISKIPGVDPRRADVILASSLIIERLLDKFRVPAFEVMDRGIRFGKLFDTLRGFQPPVIYPS